MSELNYKIFLVLLLFLPLGFGAMPQATALLSVDAVIILLFFRYRRELRKKASSLYQVPGFLPLFLLAGFMLFQLIPLPPAGLKLISPSTWKLYHETIWVVRPDAWMPLSVEPSHTLRAVSRYFSYLFLYFLTVQALVERERIHNTIQLLAVFAGLFSLVGVSIYSPAKHSGAHGAFAGVGISHLLTNSQAGTDWAIVVILLLLGFFLAFRPRTRYGTLVEKIQQFFKNPSINQYILHVILILLIASAIVFQQAAGAAVVGIAIFAGMILASRGDRRSGLFLLVVAVLLGLGGLFWNLSPFSKRLNLTAENRIASRVDPLQMVRDYALTGTGFGTYGDILPRYQVVGKSDLRASADIFKLIGEGGAIGLLLGGWFVFSLLRKTLPHWKQRKNRTASYLYPGALAALVAVLINGFTHLTPSAYPFFFLAGVVVATAHIRSGEKKVTDLIPFSSHRQILVPILALGILFLSVIVNGGILLGKHNLFDRGGGDLAEQTEQPGYKTVQRLFKQNILDPLEPEYPFAMAKIYLAWEDYDRAIDFLGKALRLAPLNGKYVQALGLALGHQGEDGKAEKLLRAGLKDDPFAADRYKEFALWLFSKKKMQDGLSHISQALALEPGKTPTYLALMDLYGISKKTMREVLPPNAVSYLAFGNFLLAKNREKAAEKAYRKALAYARGDDADKALIWRLYRYYMDRGKAEDALQVIQKGVHSFPEDIDFRMMAAGLYERMGITFRAVEEYRHVLLLDPDNRSARKHLLALSEQ